MNPFRELLAIDHRQALEFFTVRLQEIAEPDVDREELLYNASVLAHYAQTSIYADTDLGAPANLSAVFDNFVCDSTLIHDGEMMETAGAQCLLLAGFFQDQMSRRHNIRWRSMSPPSSPTPRARRAAAARESPDATWGSTSRCDG